MHFPFDGIFFRRLQSVRSKSKSLRNIILNKVHLVFVHAAECFERGAGCGSGSLESGVELGRRADRGREGEETLGRLSKRHRQAMRLHVQNGKPKSLTLMQVAFMHKFMHNNQTWNRIF